MKIIIIGIMAFATISHCLGQSNKQHNKSGLNAPDSNRVTNFKLPHQDTVGHVVDDSIALSQILRSKYISYLESRSPDRFSGSASMLYTKNNNSNNYKVAPIPFYKPKFFNHPDAVKPDGTAVIIKPDTPSGRKSAAKREKLMEKNDKKTETILYDPKDPKYQPGSSTYIGPKN